MININVTFYTSTPSRRHKRLICHKQTAARFMPHLSDPFWYESKHHFMTTNEAEIRGLLFRQFFVFFETFPWHINLAAVRES